MDIHFRPRLAGPVMPNFELNLTHPTHLSFQQESFLGIGNMINETRARIGNESGTFERAMLQALDRVSAHQQFASELHREAIINPGSVDVHDITIAQAEARMSLSIAHTVLNRVVQSWRDLINIR